MFERDYIVLPSDAGTRGIIKPRNLIDCLQDTADMAVTKLNADVHSVMESGYAWILVHIKMSVDRWPKLSEKITCRTWHSVDDKLYLLRAFDILTDDGKTIVNGSSSWLLLDVARLRPVRAKNNLPQVLLRNGENNPYISSEFTELPKEHAATSKNIDVKTFEVRLHDLDANDHVNNAVYIEWAVESVPRDMYMNHKLIGWDVIYRKGAHLGDEVIVKTKEEHIESSSPGRAFTGIIKTGEKSLCTVRTYWH